MTATTGGAKAVPSTKITVRMDEGVKSQLEGVLDSLGMNLTTGINVWARAIIRHGGFPFELSDPFFNEANMARLEKSKEQIASGNVIYKTDQELGLVGNV